MLKEAEYQLLHYPKRTIVGRIKRIIKSAAGRKVNWPNGLLAKDWQIIICSTKIQRKQGKFWIV